MTLGKLRVLKTRADRPRRRTLIWRTEDGRWATTVVPARTREERQIETVEIRRDEVRRGA